MSRFNTILSIVLISTFTACNYNEPTACFNASKTSVLTGEEIDFSNCSLKANGGYEWNFGDGTSATESDVSHSYDQAGTYVVRMIAKTKKGIQNVVEKTIKVSDPVATFIGEYSTSNACDSFVTTDRRFTLTLEKNTAISVNFINFANTFETVFGNLSGSKIIIPNQKVKVNGSSAFFDIRGELKYPYPGNSKIIQVNYIITDTLYDNFVGVANCAMEGIK